MRAGGGFGSSAMIRTLDEASHYKTAHNYGPPSKSIHQL